MVFCLLFSILIKFVFCVCVVQPTAVEDAERDITTTVMGIYTIRRDGHEEPEDMCSFWASPLKGVGV